MIEIKLYEENYFAVKKDGTWFKVEYILNEKRWEDRINEYTHSIPDEQSEINSVKKMYEKKFEYIERFIEAYQHNFKNIRMINKEITPTVCKWVFEQNNELFSVNIAISKEKEIKHFFIGKPGGKINRCNIEHIKTQYPILNEVETWFFTKSCYRIKFLF
jgi:hypothetical protein